MEKKFKSVHMIQKEKLHLLPFGVPNTKFYSDLEVRRNYRNLFKIEEGTFTVFINAHNDEIKGIDVVKDLFNSFPTHGAIKFVVVDQAELFKEIPNVIRIPRISEPSRMNGILNAADAVLIPSLGESFSLLTLEAMNCSKPVICLENSAPNELIGHDSELVFKPSESSKKIIELILELASNNERAEREGFDNQARALKEYSFDRYVQNHVKIYSRLLVQAKNRKSEKRDP
jgi:glycosyltransferase involved in cell wall biosynthesis